MSSDSNATEDKQWPWSDYKKGYEVANCTMSLFVLQNEINDEDNFYVLEFPKKDIKYIFINNETYIPMIKQRLEILQELEHGHCPWQNEDSDSDY